MNLHILMMDAIEAQAMLSLQASLQSVGSLLALHKKLLPYAQYGFCALKQTAKEITLQARLFCSKSCTRAAICDDACLRRC